MDPSGRPPLGGGEGNPITFISHIHGVQLCTCSFASAGHGMFLKWGASVGTARILFSR